MDNRYLMIVNVAVCAGMLSVLTGCVTNKNFNFEGLMNLKRLNENQRQIDKELKAQEKQFNRLLTDIEAGAIEEGMSRESLIAAYGEPLYSKPLPDRVHVDRALIYRHPTEYFSSALIYLYLDEEDKLVMWEKIE